MVLYSLAVAIVGALGRYAGTEVGPWMVIFIQNAVAFVLIAPLALRHGWEGLKSCHPYLQMTRAVSGTLAYVCLFAALAMAPLTDVILMSTTSPLFVPVIGLFWLRSHIKPIGWLGIVLGLVGIALVLNPGRDLFTAGSIVGLGSGVAFAFVMIAIRLMCHEEAFARTLFYYFGLATLATIAPAIVTWQGAHWWIWLAMIGTGVGVILSNICLTHSLRLGPASHLSPVFYLSVIFSALIDWLVWNRRPDAFLIWGAILIILGGTWTLLSGSRNHGETTC